MLKRCGNSFRPQMIGLFIFYMHHFYPVNLSANKSYVSCSLHLCGASELPQLKCVSWILRVIEYQVGRELKDHMVQLPVLPIILQKTHLYIKEMLVEEAYNNVVYIPLAIAHRCAQTSSHILPHCFLHCASEHCSTITLGSLSSLFSTLSQVPVQFDM